MCDNDSIAPLRVFAIEHLYGVPIDPVRLCEVASSIVLLENQPVDLDGQPAFEITIPPTFAVAVDDTQKWKILLQCIENTIKDNPDEPKFLISRPDIINKWFFCVLCSLLLCHYKYERWVTIVLVDGRRRTLPSYSRSYPLIQDAYQNKKRTNVVRMRDIVKNVADHFLPETGNTLSHFLDVNPL